MSTNAADKMPATEAEAPDVNMEMELVTALEMEEANPAVKEGVGEGDLETDFAMTETTASATGTSNDDPTSEAEKAEDNTADEASEQDQEDEEQSVKDETEDETEPYTPQRVPGRITFQDLTIAFQTTKAINMPPWRSTVEGDDLPIPNEGEYRYGPTEDIRSSTLIYFVDDCEMSYSAAWMFYSMLFDDYIVTIETLRRRHLRSLYRLEKRYGAKPYDQIGPLGPNVLRRGRR